MIFSSLCKGRPFIHAPGKNLGETFTWLRLVSPVVIFAIENLSKRNGALVRDV
jgi:hypothetical protein